MSNTVNTHSDKGYLAPLLLLALLCSICLAGVTIIKNNNLMSRFTGHSGSLIRESNNLPDTIAARVNEHEISRIEYERALNAYAKDKQNALTQYDRNLVLDKLIDEQLLIDDGLNSSWLMQNRQVRTTLIQSLLAGIITQTQARTGNTPTPTESQPLTLEHYIKQLRKQANIKQVSN